MGGIVEGFYGFFGGPIPLLKGAELLLGEFVTCGGLAKGA
jgi:hypothetical protein